MIKRYDNLGRMWENNTGKYLDIEDCIICKQKNMHLGDPLDNLWKQLNEQTEKKDTSGPFDVMIILKDKSNE